jgi:predicted dehydrogenase
MKRKEDLRALVIGAGSIGRRHAANLLSLGVGQVIFADPDGERLREAVAHLQERFGATPEGCSDLIEGLSAQPHMALVCSPPALHAAQAIAALQAGADVFIEKPVTTSLEELEALQKVAIETRRQVAVGYNLRFHPGLISLKQELEAGAIGRPLYAQIEMGYYLPSWRPWQDYRTSYTARRDLGGGIILDASHEIDYAIWLFGPPREVVCAADRLSDLEIDVEDTGLMLVRFESGVIASISLDMVQRTYSRGCKVIGSEGNLIWRYPEAGARAGEADPPCEEADPNLMYMNEMRAFLAAVSEPGEAGAHSSLEEASLTLRTALAALQSAEEKRWVQL